jgi:flagellar basal body-associated protein FliL
LSDSYERKDTARKKKKKAALLIVVIIIIIIINALNLKKRSSLTLREEER